MHRTITRLSHIPVWVACMQAAEAVAYAGASRARVRLVETAVGELAEEVALEAYADTKAAEAEAEADRHLQLDLGGKKALELGSLAADSKRCIVCGDFTTDAASRGGKCLYCHNNPGAIVDGRPKALQAYAQAEKVKGGVAAEAALTATPTLTLTLTRTLTLALTLTLR